ncbi:MAG: efflux RND transporter periplasmic adaptor subunit [Desulfobacteraceae bacterium]|nr:MAG: efflux RND transporter periplasmic adaptor subunit [Desulfobacteraceae bacterium]
MIILTGAIVSGIGWIIFNRIYSLHGSTGRSRASMPIPVEVAKITKGPMTLKRIFSGTLEAQAAFLAAPKIDGRVKRLSVDISDTVSHGEIIAELDNEEYIQEIAQAEADLAVSRANLVEAENARIIANREFERIKTLSNKGVKSESQLDIAKSNQLEKEAKLEVAKAHVVRAEASLETARIRLGYTKVTAEWTDDDPYRVVAERFVDEGDTVSAKTSLMSIVRLHPIRGIFFITEKDYSRLHVDQTVYLSTDAFPDQQFQGRISRIAPVFSQQTRQARIEIIIENPEQRLKPGMFIRATVVLDHVEDVTIIPEQALTRRNDRTGVFVVIEKDSTVRWKHIVAGITEGGFVQVDGLEHQGYVVILGQQLLDDGSKIIIPEPSDRKADQK